LKLLEDQGIWSCQKAISLDQILQVSSPSFLQRADKWMSYCDHRKNIFTFFVKNVFLLKYQAVGSLNTIPSERVSFGESLQSWLKNCSKWSRLWHIIGETNFNIGWSCGISSRVKLNNE
jgi:hypothetical protein